MNTWIYSLWREIWRGVSKVYLAVIILAIGTFAMAALDAGDLEALTSMDSQDVIIDVVKTVTGSIPFRELLSSILGAGLDTWDINANFTAQGGYGVMHDLGKSVLLLIVLHLLLELIKGASKLISDGNERNLLTLLVRGYFDMFLAVCISLSCMIYACILYDISLNWWLNTFGNGAISNTGYLAVLILLFAMVYLIIPLALQASLIDTLGDMLTNFGIALCILTLLAYIGAIIGLVRSGGTETGWAFLHVFLPMLLTSIGFIILLNIRTRNRKTRK